MRTPAILAGLVLSAVTASAQPVQIFAPPSGAMVMDFNAYGANTLINTQYSGLGVTTSSCVLTNNAYASDFADPMQAANFDTRGHDCAGGTAYAAVIFTFSSTMRYFGLDGLTNNRIYLTNAHGSVNEYAPVGSPAFVGFTDDLGFTSVTVSADLSGAFVMENVSFATADVVPEPASVVLMLTGLVAVGVFARRKRSAET